jgi:hypothetical protein
MPFIPSTRNGSTLSSLVFGKKVVRELVSCTAWLPFPPQHPFHPLLRLFLPPSSCALRS